MTKPKIIEVHIDIHGMPLKNGPDVYFDWLEQRFKSAGIPVYGDNLISGTLERLDDPEDFSKCIYRWTP